MEEFTHTLAEFFGYKIGEILFFATDKSLVFGMCSPHPSQLTINHPGFKDCIHKGIKGIANASQLN